MTPDMINGGFEVLGFFLILNHCRVAMNDQEVKGVSIFSTLVFIVWGVWNIYWYSYLTAWYSFFGGIVLMLANMWWVGLMIYFRNKK